MFSHPIWFVALAALAMGLMYRPAIANTMDFAELTSVVAMESSTTMECPSVEPVEAAVTIDDSLTSPED